MRLLPLLLALCLLVSGCSRDKEKCHALVLAAIETDNAYREVKFEAATGNRAKFEQASEEFDAAVVKLKAVDVSGDGLRATARRAEWKTYVDNTPKIVPAYRRLLEAVEKNPNLGKKHAEGVAFLGSLDDLPKDFEDADLHVNTSGRVLRDLTCD